MMIHESMKLVTFRTEESTEKSIKSMDESNNGWRNQENTSLKFELKLGQLLGRKKPAEIYRGPLVLVGDPFPTTGPASSRDYRFTPGWSH
jgi:hypothetical protein